MRNMRLEHILKPERLPADAELNLGELLDKQWEGFYIRHAPYDGPYKAYKNTHEWNLFVPTWRSGFSGNELSAHLWRAQSYYSDAQRLKYVQKEIDRANERADAAEARAEWAIQQLKLESRYGAMLQRMFTDIEGEI